MTINATGLVYFASLLLVLSYDVTCFNRVRAAIGIRLDSAVLSSGVK